MTNLIRKVVTDTDRKRVVTLKEFKEIKRKLSKFTSIISTYTEIRDKHYFYCITFASFPEYPQFIGNTHAVYGRNIELNTYFHSDKMLTLCIRGNSKEVPRYKS